MYNAKININRVVLETERLYLRAFKMSDLDDFYAYASVEGVGEWAGWSTHKNKDESRLILQNFIATKKTFAIVDKNSGRVIGSLGIEKTSFPRSYYPRHSVREIGYVLAKDCWGKGLMSEAVKKVIAYCFEKLHLDYLTVAHFPSNIRSQRVIEKMGFQYVFSANYQTVMGIIVPDNRYYILKNPAK